jgi:hypothetical protein
VSPPRVKIGSSIVTVVESIVVVVPLTVRLPSMVTVPLLVAGVIVNADGPVIFPVVTMLPVTSTPVAVVSNFLLLELP